MNSDVIGEMLNQGRLRPKPGHLWCEKILTGRAIAVDGLGSVTGTETESGLVLVTGKGEEDEARGTKLLVVRAVGGEVPAWRFRFFGKERDFRTSFKEQGVEVGTVVAVRTVAGIEQDTGSRYVEVRYDELSAIGQPKGSGLGMLPAPGWIAVDIGLERFGEARGGLFIRPEMQDVLEGSCVRWGSVVGLPRGYDEDLVLGSRVCFDRHHYMEYMMSGDTRFMPQDEILAVDE